MNKEEIKPPTKDLSNQIHEYINSCVKTLSGGFINPLIDFALPSSHQKRFEIWCENIYKAIIELEENIISRENLLADEEFISLLKESVTIASKTHQEEKHQLLKNALINNFNSYLAFDSKLIFTRLIDSLTISHLYFLRLIEKYATEIKDKKIFTEIKEILKKDSMSEMIPDNSYQMIINDLEKLNLIAIGDLVFKNIVRKSGALLTGDGDKNLPYLTITSFGNDFIKYIIKE
ncbi:hypothetical protein [Plebeiibacterium sediminum]|uniref:Uncharacterized protein n=1 Tax=Plebeiibacterium sediminum TaxID=2992112 RepID=A0AAE3SHG5_9BACT|nr:hypothetical protein [Plebeiobacterium sediminum]MCW3789553.1 hypothetical protein [Plebeiobacterium sediminum]